MNLRQFTILFLLLALVSCRQRTAFDYSETVVRLERELSVQIQEADRKVSAYLEEHNDDSAILVAREMENMAAEKLKQIEELEAPKVKQGEAFKKAAVRYFTYIRNIYTAFRKFTMAKTEEQKEIERQHLAQIVKNKAEATESMQQAQLRFASANDFRIEKNKR